MKKFLTFCLGVFFLLSLMANLAYARSSILDILDKKVVNQPVHFKMPEKGAPANAPAIGASFMAEAVSNPITVIWSEAGYSYDADYIQLEITTESDSYCSYVLDSSQSQEMLSIDGKSHVQTITGLKDNMNNPPYAVNFSCIDELGQESTASTYFWINATDFDKYLLRKDFGNWSYFGSESSWLDNEGGLLTMYNGAYFLNRSENEIIVSMVNIMVFDNKESVQSFIEDSLTNAGNLSTKLIGGKIVYLLNVSEGSAIIWSSENKLIMFMVISPSASSLISFVNPFDYPLDVVTAYLKKYPSSVCMPNWIKDANGCQPNGKMIISYHDLNSCKIMVNLPLDNGTYNSCSYSNLTLRSPIGGIYNSLKINFSIDSSVKLNKLEYIDYSQKSPRWTILCTKCLAYNKVKSFLDGQHDIAMRANSTDGKITLANVSFFIDSKAPQISYQPTNKEFTNGSDLSIKYSEENVQSIILIYGNNEITRKDCVSGKNKICSFNVNLESYDGKKISYGFRIIDVAGNFKDSKNTTLFADTTPPKITKLEYPISAHYVSFNINVDEINFDGAKYIDYNDSKPKWNNLCTKLKSGNCAVKKYFKTGNHNVTIQVLDEAGNSAEQSILFKIT